MTDVLMAARSGLSSMRKELPSPDSRTTASKLLRCGTFQKLSNFYWRKIIWQLLWWSRFDSHRGMNFYVFKANWGKSFMNPKPNLSNYKEFLKNGRRSSASWCQEAKIALKRFHSSTSGRGNQIKVRWFFGPARIKRQGKISDIMPNHVWDEVPNLISYSYSDSQQSCF